MSECQECGMLVSDKQYHPYAACLMFKGCHDSRKVQANLDAVIAHGLMYENAELDAARLALERIAKFPHPTQAATGDAMKGYLEALNDVGAVAEQALSKADRGE